MQVYTNAQTREADKKTISGGVPSEVLMKRAGKALFEEIKGFCAGKEVLVVCGNGNNGGDGFVLAKLLHENGYKVRAYEFGGKLSDDCKREREEYRGEYSKEIRGDIIADCIFGTGLCRPVDGEYAEVINKINSSGAFVLSADIPSGINGDNGLIEGIAVKADLTVCIGSFKSGVFLADGVEYSGKVKKADIGIIMPEKGCGEVLGEEDLAAYFPARRRNSHKGNYGCAFISAGSEEYIGAAALALEGALRSGCGYIKLKSSEKVKFALAPVLPQVIYCKDYDLNAEAIAVGSGRGVSKELYEEINYLLNNYCGKLLIDADGLNCLAKYGADILKNKKCEVVLTPHIGEFERLSGLKKEEITADPIGCGKAFSEKYGVTLLLKNSSSVIVGGGRTVINPRGTTALSKGGSGDMLSGLAAGFMARGLSAFDGAVCASYILGLAAEEASKEKSDYCADARDILKNIHIVVKRLTDGVK